MSTPIQTKAGAVNLSRHVIERYVERVKPAFTHGHAHYELARLLPQAEVSLTTPPWLGENPEQHTDCWLILCDSVAFPVFGMLVTTCFTRGTFGPVQRSVRSQHNRWRRQHKRAIEKKGRTTGARRQRKAGAKRERTDYGEAA